MKHFRLGWMILVLVLGCAAYFHSWWLVMCGLFLFAVEYAAQEFADLKQRLTCIEDKLDVLSKNK